MAPGSWPADYEILRLYDEHDIHISAKGLARNIGYSRRYANCRLNVLADAGLLDRENGLYALLHRDRRFLEDAVARNEIEKGP